MGAGQEWQSQSQLPSENLYKFVHGSLFVFYCGNRARVIRVSLLVG